MPRLNAQGGIEVGTITCPNEECGAELDHMNYSCDTSGREYGSASIGPEGATDHESDDSETSDCTDYSYRCPECDTDISEEYVREHYRSTTVSAPRALQPSDRESSVVRGGYAANANTKFFSSLVSCPKCEHGFEVEEREDYTSCPKCSTELYIKTFTPPGEYQSIRIAEVLVTS